MLDLTTMITTLSNIKKNLKAALVRSPNSDLAVSLVKLNTVIFELKSLQKDINKNDDVIRLIVRMAKKDIAFTEEEAVKFYHEN